MNHFDEIADSYDQQIPSHIVEHLLQKKTGHMIAALQSRSINAGRGVDLGCGTGHHVRVMREAGYEMSGLEHSRGMAEKAIENNAAVGTEISIGSILDIPYEAESFDFGYSINVLHHLPDLADQKSAMAQVHRILRPGGIFFLQDFNCDNVLFRIYMDYIFQFTSSIDDDDTELWISPAQLKQNLFEGFEFEDCLFFTFVPNFIPKWLSSPSFSFERALETLTKNRQGAHYMAILRKAG